MGLKKGASVHSHEQIKAQMQAWLEQFVLELNLCPFARQPWEAGSVLLQVSDARDDVGLLNDLHAALQLLDETDQQETETLLLVVGNMLEDFHDYNDFLDLADALLEQFAWEGKYQIASFHPQYQFAGTAPDDASNYTNRAPWPILHLLRESSVAQVLKSYPDPERIPERNIDTMDALGRAELATRLLRCRNQG